MRKLIWRIGIVLVVVSMVSACSNNVNQSNEELVEIEPLEENDNQNVHEEQEDEGLENEEQKNEDQNAEENHADDQSSLTAADLEGGVVIGSSRENIISLLGDDYEEVVAALTGEIAWRYDVDAIDGYDYVSHTDTPDLDGLAKGDLTIQVFIFFNEEEKVTGYSAYESRAETETIDVYHLMEDGSRITEQIN